MGQLIYIVLLLIVFPCMVWGIVRLLDKNRGELTGHATVKSHRVERSSTWNYMLCFEFSDSSTLELRTTKGDYQTLKDGQSGQLTWEDGLLLHFDPDIP